MFLLPIVNIHAACEFLSVRIPTWGGGPSRTTLGDEKTGRAAAAGMPCPGFILTISTEALHIPVVIAGVFTVERGLCCFKPGPGRKPGNPAFRAGANGYFVSGITCDRFIRSIELVMMGETIFPSEYLSFTIDTNRA